MMPTSGVLRDDRFVLSPWAWALALMLPSLAIFQPLLPGPLEAIVLYGRLVAGPLLIALLLPHIILWPALLLLMAFVIGTTFEAFQARSNDAVLTFCSLLSSIIAFRFGAWVSSEGRLDAIWPAVIAGVTLANLLTLVAFAAALQGWVDVEALLTQTNKLPVLGLARFSIGNAIEVPFVLTALLYAGVANSKQGGVYLGSAALNLSTALIAQSRIVLLVAALIFVREFVRSGRAARAGALLLASMLIAVLSDELSVLLESIVARFSGDDAGSTDDRAFIFEMVAQQLTSQHLLIGDGLTAASQLMFDAIREYRTVESAAAQLLLELGLFGIALLLLTLWPDARGRLSRVRRPSLAVFLLWTQLLLFLPLIHLLPFAMFGLGALTFTGDRRHEGSSVLHGSRRAPPVSQNRHAT